MSEDNNETNEPINFKNDHSNYGAQGEFYGNVTINNASFDTFTPSHSRPSSRSINLRLLSQLITMFLLILAIAAISARLSDYTRVVIEISSVILLTIFLYSTAQLYYGKEKQYSQDDQDNFRYLYFNNHKLFLEIREEVEEILVSAKYSYRIEHEE